MKQILSTLSAFVLAVSFTANCRTANVAQVDENKGYSSAENNKISLKAENNSINVEHLPTPDEKHLLPAPKGFVNDFADVLDEEIKAELGQTLLNFKTHDGIDFDVVTVKTTGGKTIFDYSLKLANDWEIAANNQDRAGVLLLVAVEDRTWHIQIPKTLEKVLSNDEVRQTGAVMNPFFKEQKYGEGIIKCAEKLIEVLREKRGIKQQ